MFGLFKKRAKESHPDLRDMLFGDVPLENWRSSNAVANASEPWSSFAEARAALGEDDRESAIASLRRITKMEGLESRQLLQAWHFLRGLGVQPDPGHAKHVRGVVLEVQLNSGLDTLAAYDDHRARYLNHGGKVIVWETTHPDIDPLIDALLAAGQRVADMIGPWEEARRGPPAQGYVRLNMLTDSGLHFGEGPMSGLSTDERGGPIIAAGTRLMQALVARATSS